jgi:hypothetical protein
MKIIIAIAGKAKFDLGQIVSTPGALEACPPDHLTECLTRHACGDWGNVCAEDAASNDEAITEGLRVLSAYPIDPTKPSKGFGDNTLWIITEASVYNRHRLRRCLVRSTLRPHALGRPERARV